jgi:ribosomal protein RSM22 (predicted rRNA methylase)
MLSGRTGVIIERATIKDAEEILDLQKLAYKSEAEIYNDYAIPPLPHPKPCPKCSFYQRGCFTIKKSSCKR